MALINIGAGLSELGKTVAHTAAAWTLEDQRREADLEKAKLVDQLMAAREGTARRESHANALELEGRRQEFEKPHKEAQTAALRSGTGMAEDKARRERETGESVSGILSGSGRFDSYGERLRGYEGGTKKGGMVDNELGSGAYGPFQFMPSTWGDVRKANPDLNLPEDMRQATAQQHKAAFDKFTATNADALQKAGIEPTAANLYLAHRFGAGGAQAVIRADEGKLLSEILPPEWQKQNPDMRGQTVAGFKRLAEERMKGVTLASGGEDPALVALSRTDTKEALALRERRRESAAKEAADPEAIKIAKALEKFTPEQWAALTKYQEVQREKKAPGAHTFGWEPDPDNPGGMRPVKGGERDPDYIGRVERAKSGSKTPEAFKKLETEVRTVGGAIDRFQDVVKKYGGGSIAAFLNDPTSKEAQEYNTAFTAMKTALRSEAFVNTGVLQPAEMAMLDKELLAPTTVRGLLSNPEAYKAKFDELRRFLDNKIQSAYKSHGQELPPDLRFYKEEPPAAPVRISTPKEYDALKPNTRYIAPDGSVRTKR